MAHGEENGCGCGGAQEILDDLIEQDLLELKPGERLWRLYCFKDNTHPTGLRHRIYTKQKADGRLALVTFAVHNPAVHNPQGRAIEHESAAVRSAVARVPDLSPTDLDRLIAAMRAQAGSDACQELDLSTQRALADQMAWLRAESG